MDGWIDTATDPYELSGIARRDQKAYENWRDSADDDGHEMSRIFQSIGVRPIKQDATEEF